MGNWKIDINATYYSKHGHDSRAGSKEEPKRTVKAANCVIGSGTYVQNVAYLGAINITMQADGYVKILCTSFAGARSHLIGLVIEGNPTFAFATTFISSMQDCIVKNCTGGVQSVNLGNTIIINSTITNASCTLDGGIMTASTLLCPFPKNSYIDRSSVITSITNITHCNVEGVLNIDGNLYAIQDELAGSPQDNGYSAEVSWLNEVNLQANGFVNFAGWDAKVATCTNKDPRFVDADRGVYKLRADSPMIGAASNGLDNIGSQPVGVFITPDGADNETRFVIISPEMDVSNPSQPRLRDGEEKGTIRYVFKVSDIPLNFDSPIDFEGVIANDSDFGAGSPQNSSVPSAVPGEDIVDLITSVGSPDNLTIICNNNGNGHGLNIGDAVLYQGQTRTVSNVIDFETFTVDIAFAAPIPQLEPFLAGSRRNILAIIPDRIDFEFRSSVKSGLPGPAPEWDNDLDPNLGYAGTYFVQEFYDVPQKIISGNQVWGNGDPERPLGVGSETFNLSWIDALLTFRKGHK